MIIGQDEVVGRLRIWIATKDYRNLLLRGFAGSGKTTLAKMYAESVAENGIYYYQLCNGTHEPPEGNYPIILDEIHRLRQEEMWYDYPGVLVGCTTEGSPVSEPLRTRMVEMWLRPYTIEQIEDIIRLNASLPEVMVRILARRCRGIPRLAVNLGREVVSVLKYYNWQPDDESSCGAILDSLGAYRGGFTDNDRHYLEYLRQHQPASARTISLSLNLPLDTIVEEIEPFLLQKGLISITSRGRICGQLQG